MSGSPALEMNTEGKNIAEMNILICEDNQLASRAMSVVLERAGISNLSLPLTATAP